METVIRLMGIASLYIKNNCILLAKFIIVLSEKLDCHTFFKEIKILFEFRHKIVKNRFTEKNGITNSKPSFL